MRLICTILISLIAFASACCAEQLSNEQILEKTRTIQKAPKSKAELEGVTLWCVDSLIAPILREAVDMQVKAIDAIQANKMEEANRLVQAAEAEKKAGRTLAKSLCAPQR